MSDTARVARLPLCDFHPNETHDAEYDFKTRRGPWGNGCREAWELNRAYPDLGTGKGQRLVLVDDDPGPLPRGCAEFDNYDESLDLDYNSEAQGIYPEFGHE